MTAIEALEKISDYIKEKRESVYSEMGFASEYKFHLEWQALQYKAEVYNDINGEILMLIHKLNQEEDDQK
jgi:hypothetical protein